MPTYEYHCDTCARNFDVVQSFSDAPLEACPTCGAPVRKVFGTVGIVFKGSGFYKTDSRSTSAASVPSGERKPEGAAASGESAPSTGATGESASTPTPAPAPAAKTESTGGK